MTALLQILLVADIALSLVSAPIFATGLGFGAGAGGSSLPQKTQIDTSSDDQKTAYLIFSQVCDQNAWNKQANSYASAMPIYPKNAQEMANLSKFADKIEWEKFCPGKDFAQGSNETGIKIIGSPGFEVKLLVRDLWDKRNVYNIAYLLQKRFLSPNGAKATCTEGGFSAPYMTLAIHWDGYGTLHTNSAGEPIKPQSADPEDDISNGGNISPHAYGQAIDFLTFGCTRITKNEFGREKLLGITPNPMQMALTRAVDVPTQDVTMQNAVSMLPIDNSNKQVLIKSQNNSPTAFSAGLSSLSEDFAPVLALQGVAPASNSLMGLDQIANSSQSPSDLDLTPVLDALSAEQFEMPANSLQNGFDLKQIGRSSLEENIGASAANDKSNNFLNKVINAVGSFSFAIPQTVQDLLRSEKKDLALPMLGISKLNDKFNLNLTSREIETVTSSGKLPNSLQDQITKKITAAQPMLGKLLSGNSNQQIQNLASSMENSPDYKLAEALDKTGGLSEDEIESLKQFTNPASQDSIITKLSSRQGSKYDKLVAWLKEHKSTTTGTDATKFIQIVNQFQSSATKLIQVSSVDQIKGQIILEALNQTNPANQKIILEYLKILQPTAQNMVQAAKDGRLQTAIGTVKLTNLLKNSGLSDSKAWELASSFTASKDKIQSAVDKFNQEFSSHLSPADLVQAARGENQNNVSNAVAAKQISETTGVPADEIIKAFASGNQKSISSLANIFANKKSLNTDLASAAATLDTNKISENGLNQQFDQLITLSGNSNLSEQELAGLKDSFANASQSESGQKDFAKELSGKKFSSSAINQISKGDFSNSSTSAYASALSRATGIDANTALQLVNGQTRNNAFYSLSDQVVNEQLATDGYFFNFSSKTLVEGTDAQREQMAKEAGLSVADKKIQDLAKENNIPVSLVREIIQNPQLETLANANPLYDKLARGLAAKTGLPISSDKIVSYFKSKNVTSLNEVAQSAGDKGIADYIEKSGALTSAEQKEFTDSWGKDKNGSFTILEGEDSSLKSKNSPQQDKIAETIANNSGGILNKNQVNDLYQKIQTDNLTLADLGSVGKNVISNQTGISFDQIKNIDQTFAAAKNNITQSYQNFISADNFNLASSTIGASVLTNTLGKEFVKIDPTGGLATGYLMNMAQKQLLTLAGGPALMAVAFIIDPSATIASVKATVDMAFSAIINPIGFVSGVLGGILGGNKPKGGTKAQNIAFEKNTPNIGQRSSGSNGNLTEVQAQISPAQSQSQVSPSSSAPPSLSESQKSVSSQSQTQKQAALAVKTTASDYVPQQDYSQTYQQAVSVRTLDQIIEDLLILYAAQNSGNTKTISNVWGSIMGDIKLPEKSLAAHQIVLPRVLAPKDDANTISQFVDRMYQGEGSGNHWSQQDLINAVKTVYSANYNPASETGRAPYLSFSQKLNYIHLSF